MIYIVTGKLGSGKSLLAVDRAIQYASEGRRVAANFHMDFTPICHTPGSHISKTPVTVIPSIPTTKDLLMLGFGGEREDTAGALFLDECAQFLNSRTWQGKDREGMINWLLHARKRAWDVFLIVQHERMLDKQVRDALAEYVVTIKRTDRLKVPFVPIKFPRLHVGIVRYGLDQNAMVADRWITRGGQAMECYDTRAIFNDDSAAYSVLPATMTKFAGQLQKPKFRFADLVILPPALLVWIACRIFGYPPPLKVKPV
jgi:hypothetical protein